MSCFSGCLSALISGGNQGAADLPRKENSWRSNSLRDYWSQWQQPGSTDSPEGEAEEKSAAGAKVGELEVTSMAGLPILNLPIVEQELVSALKERIYTAEGTPASYQVIMQEGRLLGDFEEVLAEEPVLLVRRQRKLAVAVFTNRIIAFWDLMSGEGLQRFSGHSHVIKSVAADWDSMLCFTGSADKTVRVWDIASGSCLMIFEGFTHWVSKLCLDAAGKKLLAADMEGTVKLCNFGDDALSGPAIQTGHEGQHISLSCDWSCNVVLIMSDGRRDAAAYDFCSGLILWKLDVFEDIRGLEVDWESRTVLLNSGRRLHLMTLFVDGKQGELTEVSVSDGAGRQRDIDDFRVSWRRQQVLTLVNLGGGRPRNVYIFQPGPFDFKLQLWNLRGSSQVLQLIEGMRFHEILGFDVDWDSGPEIKTSIVGSSPLEFWHVCLGEDKSEVEQKKPELRFKDDRTGGWTGLSLPVAVSCKP